MTPVSSAALHSFYYGSNVYLSGTHLKANRSVIEKNSLEELRTTTRNKVFFSFTFAKKYTMINIYLAAAFTLHNNLLSPRILHTINFVHLI